MRSIVNLRAGEVWEKCLPCLSRKIRARKNALATSVAALIRDNADGDAGLAVDAVPPVADVTAGLPEARGRSRSPRHA